MMRFKMRMRHTKTLLSLLLLVLCVACANIGSPDGGPFDETPPKVVSTSPKFGATNTKATKIVLEFDENIKITNASEKVIVSPPQVEQPEINASGKTITIELLDSIKEGETYTIDFADAIEDNNEGNPLGDYAFSFSTGERIDTMQISGNVLNASNLEPIKGILVGVYSIDSVNTYIPTDTAAVNPDSLLRFKTFERISRTDSRGHFSIKGIAPGTYRVYALQDQNQNYVFDQKSEMIAFVDRVVSPYSAPDVRQDTIWHDSIYYDSIVNVNYTHYYPDDIVLLAFNETGQNRYLVKSERPILNQFSLFFSAPHDSLPEIKGLNFNADGAFVVDKSEKNDTVNYWIRDSLVYNIDTLELTVSYYATDTLNVLVPRTDTLTLVSKLTKKRMQKEQEEAFEEWAKEYREQYKREQRELERAAEEAEELAEAEGGDKGAKKKKAKKEKIKDEDIEIPPMPEEFMEMKLSNTSGMDPDKNVTFTMPEPIASIDTSFIHFSEKVDTLLEPRPFLFRKVPGEELLYRFYAEWEPDKKYELRIDTGAFVNIYGKRSPEIKREVSIKSLDAYSTFFVTLQGNYPNAIVQLIDGSDKVVRYEKANNGKADFYFVRPGTYYLRMIDDTNANGEWDTGNYDEHLQPENVYYYPGAFELRAQWDISQTWNPTAVAVPQQKPLKITKQKPEKEKKRMSKNAEREREKNKRKK